MIRRAPILAAALLCAGPLASQGLPRGPRLMQVVASSGGVVLSIDSATVARTGASTLVADAVYQFPADSTQRVAPDRQVDGGRSSTPTRVLHPSPTSP